MILTLAEWQTTYKDPADLIVQASSIRCDDGWQSFPIGMSWQYVLNHKLGPALQFGGHEKLFLCALSAGTDRQRRPVGINRRAIIDTLDGNGIKNRLIDHHEYFTTLPSYKFVMSPEGNGIDCHRHYEALLAGCIPVMERNPLTEEKYRDCPILYTTDYSEITPAYLEQKYKTMIDKEYNFARLFLSYYDDHIQEDIKDSGNFWLKRIQDTNCTWYT